MSSNQANTSSTTVQTINEQSIRSEWSSIVDSIASIDSTQQLPSTYNKTDYLPNNQQISKQLIRALRKLDGKFAKQSEDIFKVQMNFKEGCHAKPILPHFINKSREEVVFTLNSSQGPNFYHSYKTIRDSGKENGNDVNGVRGSASMAPYAASSSSLPHYHHRHHNHPYSNIDNSTHRSKQRRVDSVGKGRRRMSSGGVYGGVSRNNDFAMTRMVNSPSRLASGLMDVAYYNSVHRQPDFMPIILVSSSISSALQLMNIRQFVQQGIYIDPTSLFIDQETGAMYVVDVKPDAVIISPGSFLDRDKYNVAFMQFKVVDDPAKVNNWSHVCACFVDGVEWQFMRWFPDEPSTSCAPSQLFNRVRGFLPYFEQDKIPLAIQQWRVQPIVLTRRLVKAHQHILQASIFWEQLYTFLDDHPFFRWYTIRLEG